MLTQVGGPNGDRYDEILRVISPEIHVTEENALTNLPDNLFVNQYYDRRDDDGRLHGWAFNGVRPETVGFYVLLTPEGLPQQRFLSRQNTSLLEGVSSWVAQNPIVDGMRVKPTVTRKAPTPELEAIPGDSRGHVSGRRGIALGWSQRSPRGKRKATPPGGTRYFDLDTGQIPRVWAPDQIPWGAEYLDVYMTPPNSMLLFLQRSVPVQKLRDFVDLIGPYRRNKRAPTQNTTGMGSPPRRIKDRDYRLIHDEGSMREGIWTPLLQMYNRRGASLLSAEHKPLIVRGELEWKLMNRDELKQAGIPPGQPPTSGSSVAARYALGNLLVDECESRARKNGAGVYTPDAEMAEAFASTQRSAHDVAEAIAGAHRADASGGGGSGTVDGFPTPGDPEDDFYHEAEGKRPASVSRYVERGGQYMGEEVDSDESLLVALVNENRRAARLSNLILNRDLTRIAYREVGGKNSSPESDYPGDTHTEIVYTDEDLAIDAAELVEEYSRPSGQWGAVGVAREPDGGRFKWCLVFGNRVVGYRRGESLETVCETVDPEGNTHRFGSTEHGHDRYLYSVAPDRSTFEDARQVTDGNPPMFAEGLTANTSQGWSCVGGSSANPTLGWKYSGSYRPSLTNGMGNLVGKCKVRVFEGGGDVSISDASLGGNTYGRTYSDGRMYGDSYQLSVHNGNDNEAMWGHEGLHALGQPHHSDPSSLAYYRIDRGRSPNPTSGDVSRLVSTWGPPTSGGGGGNTGGGGGEEEPGGGGGEEPEPPKPEWKLTNTGFKKNSGVFFRTPLAVRRHDDPTVRYAPWFKWEPVSAGGGGDTGTSSTLYYRAYPKKDPLGKAATLDNRGRFERGVVYNGYLPESEPPGLFVGSVQEEPPTEDTTKIADPDPTSVPDEPGLVGNERPSNGKYLGAVQERYSDGTVSRRSDIGWWIDQQNNVYNHVNLRNVGNPPVTEMIRVNLPTSVNQIKNAAWTQLDAKGIPEQWIARNMQVITNTFDATDGVLTIKASSTTNLPPYFTTRLMALDAERPLTIVGRLDARNTQVGSTRITLKQYDENRSLLGTILVHDQKTLGEISLEKLYSVGGALGGQALDSSCVYYSLRIGLQPASATTPSGEPGEIQGDVQGEVRFSRLKALPFDADVPQIAFGSDTEKEFDSLISQPSDAVPGSTFIVSGEPPPELGEPIEAEDQAESILDFEGPIPSGWTKFENGVLTGATTLTNPVHGTTSYRVQDASTAGGGGNGYAYDLGAGRKRVAFRGLYRFDGGPQTGYARHHDILDVSGNVVAQLRRGSAGGLSVAVNERGVEKVYPLGSGIYTGQLYDVEIIFTANEGSQKGTIAVGFATGSDKRRIVFNRQFDFGTRKAKTLRGGSVGSSNSQVRYTLLFDRLVVTEGGDILDRERPTPPTGFVVQPPNRPTLTGSRGQTGATYRNSYEDPLDFDEDGNPSIKKIGLTAHFVRPGDAPVEDPEVVEMLTRPVFVKPGFSYTLALFIRWSVFTADAAPGIRVKLTGEGLDPLYVTPTAGTLGPMSGKRLWHDAGRNREDDYLTFDVPEMTLDEEGYLKVYTHAQVEIVLHDGMYYWQEPLFHQGVLSTFSERESKRGFGRAEVAQVLATINLEPPEWDAGIPAARVRLSEWGVKLEESEDLPEGVEIVTDYRTSSDLEALGLWSSNQDDIANVSDVAPRTPEQNLQIRSVLYGDGVSAPEISAGGIFARSWHSLGVLLRKDGSHFPGAAFVGNLITEDEYPDVDVSKVGGHFVRVDTSDAIGRIDDEVFITVSTEAARQEISALALTDDLRMAVPFAGGTLGGRSWLVRFGAQPEWQYERVPPYLSNGHKLIHAYTSVKGIEVIESAPLPNPRSPAIRFGEVSLPQGVAGP